MFAQSVAVIFAPLAPAVLGPRLFQPSEHWRYLRLEVSGKLGSDRDGESLSREPNMPPYDTYTLLTRHPPGSVYEKLLWARVCRQDSYTHDVP